ncbi:hypothetical protein ADL00_29580 [Streptomyces sp. AS58]|uniref:hypothetical protein n=1 Tax=Streptomyces sp. AS58 TaxID=1519489 RepID=UPI0006AE8533|nr:hypothetical protein [Streptomyces sp. AS58]KOV54697.1 hypothetical protein ADL00_29580 [Streptomyces sp. AS58]
MSEASAVVLAGASKRTALRLLRRRSFSAGYLPQVIDLAVREVVRSQFDEPDEREAALVHQRLARYAANGRPGSAQLARAMLDVKHALNLVRHEHYRASAVPEGGLDTTVSAEQLLELVAEAGRDRVLAAQGGALVVLAEDEEASTVYRPVSAAQAKALRQAARSAKEEAIRLYEGAVEVLRPHVRLADWSRDDGYGVAVDVIRDEVSVQWWSAALPEFLALWEQGGVRQLCAALLSDRFTVSEGDGSPHAPALRI